MHSSKCIEISGVVPTIWLPRKGAQIVVASGTNVSSGLSGHRNFAVWCMLDSPDVAVAAGKENVIQARMQFIRAGSPSIVANVALGSPPYVRVIPSDDFDDVLITSPGSLLVWTESMAALSVCDP